MAMRRTATSTLALLVVALLSLAGCSAVDVGPTPVSSPVVTTQPAADVPAPVVPSVPRVRADLGSNQTPTTIAPVRLRVDTLDIDMAIRAAGLVPTGDMELPVDPAEAAWYRFGAAPASPAGATVIAAHVDALKYGLGPFARFADAPVGTEIVVTTADGVDTRYRLESVTSAIKADIPWASIFDRTGAPRLTIVTCGGEFDYDTRTYSSNVITTAVPID